MTAIASSKTLLGRTLLLDGVISGATGALMFLAAAPLSNLLGMGESLLRIAGFSLLPFAALLLFLAARPSVPRALVWGIVGANVLWTADSLLLLTTDWVAPTTLGYAFTLFQAVAVAGFAALQYVGLRGARTLVHA
ncbi:hypothetical protein HPC49_14320 [Pyxidicoccus fallax]|uniref:Integral membrane protein n=1 Tax=Pyxidicoccus fallax TaxID=394095 RepID=A0A848LHC6_9BACT|nr:hypothetical protein [Pyxidicoccus fallax]NMO15808.1 hypothetical protein [Pyxidicoccus fallax]NPC79407.1 hypothetical protein [Pyxidicoccus fallax]